MKKLFQQKKESSNQENAKRPRAVINQDNELRKAIDEFDCKKVISLIKAKHSIINQIVHIYDATLFSLVTLGNNAEKFNKVFEAIKSNRILSIESIDTKLGLDFDGNTYLHLAAAEKNEDVLKFLIQDKRMNPEEKNDKGETASEYVGRLAKEESEQLIESFLCESPRNET